MTSRISSVPFLRDQSQQNTTNHDTNNSKALYSQATNHIKAPHHRNYVLTNRLRPIFTQLTLWYLKVGLPN